MENRNLKRQTLVVLIFSLIVVALLIFLRFVEPSIDSYIRTFFHVANESTAEANMQTAFALSIRQNAFHIFKIILWFTLVILAIRLLNTLIFKTALKNAKSYELSGLITSIVNILIYIVSFFIIFKTQYPNVDLGAIFTTSTIIGVVIGLALQDTLGNLFAGFAIQADQPFQIGDVVSIPNKGSGVVEGISWRGVKIRTFQNKLLVISNSVLGKEAIEVAPRDNLNARIVRFNTVYSDSPAKTIQAVREAVRQVDNVSNKIRPIVRIGNLAADGIDWEIKYWTEDYSKFNETDAMIRQNVWYAFHRENINFAYPTRTVYMMTEQPADTFAENPNDVFERLSGVPIFSPLCREEIETLSNSSLVRVFAPNEFIVRKGSKGKSMFIVHRGTVNIVIREDRKMTVVGTLHEGDFFGEMGLFTGEERTADVIAESETKVLEIKHHSLRPILEANPELVQSFSAIIAERRADLDQQQKKSSRDGSTTQVGVVNSIRKFFGLKP